MKYKIINIVCVFLIAAMPAFWSCTKLEDESFNELLAEQFEPTEDDIPYIIGAAYGGWRNLLLLWNGYWRANEVGADQIIVPGRPNGWVDGGIYKRMHQHTWVNDDDIVNQTWSRSYDAIANCNRILYLIESEELPISDPNVYNSTVSELRALRASYYYVLCDLYGNVPIVDRFDVPDGYLPPYSTRKEVFDFIIKELKESMPYLSTARGLTTYGRFNKWAAQTLMAKMYLNAEVYTGTAHWADCVTYCDSVMSSGVGYDLENSQKNVFVTDNENSAEIIFGITIDDQRTTQWNQFDIHMQTCQPSMQAKYNLTLTPWGGMCAIPQFIDTFDPEDNRLTNNFMMGQQYAYTGEELLVTMINPNNPEGVEVGDPLNLINEVPSVDRSEEIHGYRFEKFEIAIGSTNILNNDFPLLRYADVLMMKAECLLRTGDADGAATLVTEVRNRAFSSAPEKAKVTGDELLMGSVYDYGLRDENNNTEEGGSDIQYGRFLDELAWEFNQEGRRRQDMIRFGVFTSKSWFSHSPNGNYRNIYPIPRFALEANGNLRQNDGY
nr:RagB/SusD family nutrient uptake outer membrane protein [uncultured Carboxylicivirga sp.]